MNVLKALQQARKMGSLNLQGLGLTKAPLELWQFSSFIPNQDDKWWELCELKRLDLSRNSLTELQPITSTPTTQTALKNPQQEEAISAEQISFPELKFISLAFNSLSSIPFQLLNSETLAFLDITGNKFTQFPKELSQCKKLLEIRAADNLISSLDSLLSLSASPPLQLMISCIVVANNNLAELPESLSIISKTLRTLDASGNKINKISPTLGSTMIALEELILFGNNITELPSMIGDTSLVLLDVSKNSLSKSFPNLPKSLKELRASGNQLRTLPKEVCETCASLRVLDLRGNKIIDIPDCVKQLKSLTRLDLSNNDLTNLNPNLSLIEPLVAISLAGNPLKNLRSGLIQSDGIGGLALKAFLKTRLTEDADAKSPKERSKNACESTSENPATTKPTNAPSTTSSNSDISSLAFSKLKLTMIPDEVFIPKSLKSLNLNKNLISEIDSRITKFSASLTSLNLSCNKIQSFPLVILEISSLQHLDLGGNRISEIKCNFAGKLQQLRSLILIGNGLIHFPTSITNLTELRLLDLNTNKISSIPSSISSLINLETLDLSNNDLTNIPSEICNLSHLKLLAIEGNTIRTISRTILSKGTPTILQYLRSHSQNAKQTPQPK